MKSYSENPRQISARQAKRLKVDLARFGDLGGIVHDLNSDQLVGGHQRMRVLFGEQGDVFNVKNADIEIVRQFDEQDQQGTVAHGFVVWRGFRYGYRQVRWDEETFKEANIKSNLDGGVWNWDELSGLGNEWLQDVGFDAEFMNAANFDALAVKTMLESDKPEQVEDVEPQIDRAEELRELYGCELGQIWQLGEHFVICGDCRESETWARLLAAAGVDKVNGVFTSPPYAEQRKAQYGGVPTAEYVDWWEAVQSNVKAHLAADGSFFVNIKPHCEDGQRVLYVFDLVLAMVRRWGWRFVDELSWLHEDLPDAWNNRFRNGFEPVYHFCEDGKISFSPKSVATPSNSVPHGVGGLQKTDRGNWTLDAPLKKGMAQPSNVLKIGGNTDGHSHAAAFPVALPTFFVKAYSDAGDVWLDPFLGSGTTIVAAHKEGRRGLGIELLPKYIGVIIQRWADATGGEPVLVQ